MSEISLIVTWSKGEQFMVSLWWNLSENLVLVSLIEILFRVVIYFETFFDVGR